MVREVKAVQVYLLVRAEDVSGVSGTGPVAEAVVFSDGICVLRWLRAGGSTAVYDSLDAAVRIHGHGGATRFVQQAAVEVDH